MHDLPVVAGKPLVLQPGLSPVVMSLRAEAPVEYKKGLRNPRGDLPAATSRSLIRAMTLAKIGLAQLVPATSSPSWSTTISTFSPWALTSGYARPEVLKRPLFVLPSVVR